MLYTAGVLAAIAYTSQPAILFSRSAVASSRAPPALLEIADAPSLAADDEFVPPLEGVGAAELDLDDAPAADEPETPAHDPDRPPISMFDIDDATVTLLAAKGIDQMTPVQAQSFDLLRSGRDMLARSRTGTGKTLAFSLPLVQRLAQLQREEGGRPAMGRAPKMLVLAPTRELAKQVGEVLEMLARPHGLHATTFTGGTPYPPQQRALNRGIDILVGTPGRIIDHLNGGSLDLSSLHAAVLDEADEMLNMGFKEDVETILESSEGGGLRQTVLFSATHPPWVKAVCRKFQTDPVVVDAVGKGQSEAATTVEHRAVLTPGSDIARCSTLADIISVYGSGHECRTIVFTSTKREADELCVSAPLSALSPQPLHGDVSQTQRDVTLKRFREGHFNVLVATDVAARGIDISGVDLIVQYRMPQDPDSYVHRSGRTGRAGRSGVSLLLYNERENRDVNNLERRAGVKFMRDGPPSTTTVMAAAANLVPRRLAVVQPKVRDYFTHAAEEILAKEPEQALEQVARALALVAGKVSLTERSLLTGEDGMTTLVAETIDGTPLTPNDAMAAVGQVGKTETGDIAADHVGKIRSCQDPNKARLQLPPSLAPRP